MKVSFDFDGTLDRPVLQEYAKELLARGIEVWIVTARLSDEEAPSDSWNLDLYKVAIEVGIDLNNVVFTPHKDKYHFFKGKDFVWHVDDSWTEIGLINRFTKMRGISVFGTCMWKEKCERELIKRKHEK